MKNYEVILIDSEELQRTVKVYIKLPHDYKTTETEYSTVYIHDGQVVFNDFEEPSTSFGLIDDYITSKSNNAILIGIASGKTRIDELCPFEVTRKSGEQIGGKTTKYMSFIINCLIPKIELLYRAKPHKDSRAMLGVSLGGLCTYYSLSKYNEYFSRFAIISSAHYQFHDRLLDIVKETDFTQIKKVYSDVGTHENDNKEVSKKYLDTNKDMYNLLKNELDADTFRSRIIEGSKHEFDDWNKRTTEMFQFLLSD